MRIAKEVQQYIVASERDVFLRKNFAEFGSPTQVSRALKALIDDGLVVRLGIGVYSKTKTSVLSGKPIVEMINPPSSSSKPPLQAHSCLEIRPPLRLIPRWKRLGLVKRLH